MWMLQRSSVRPLTGTTMPTSGMPHCFLISTCIQFLREHVCFVFLEQKHLLVAVVMQHTTELTGLILPERRSVKVTVMWGGNDNSLVAVSIKRKPILFLVKISFCE